MSKKFTGERVRNPVQIVNFGTKGHSYFAAILCSVYSISSLCKSMVKQLFSYFHEKMQDYVFFVVKDIVVRSWGNIVCISFVAQ